MIMTYCHLAELMSDIETDFCSGLANVGQDALETQGWQHPATQGGCQKNKVTTVIVYNLSNITHI